MPYKETLITIDEDIFDVTKFIPNHPGEGIHDAYLKNYHSKNASEEFEHYHFTDEPHTWLANARTKKFDPETGIYRVGPAYFKKRIPSYFHFLPLDKTGEEAMKTAPNKSFILLPNEENLLLVFKDDQGEVHKMDIVFKDKKWNAADADSTTAASPEFVIEKVMTQKGFLPAP